MKPSLFTTKRIGCIYNTRKGTLYQLSDYNQTLVPIGSVQVNLPEFLDKKYFLEMLEEQKITFKKYLNLEAYENYLTIYNSNTQKKILGTSNEHAIKIFVNGYKELLIFDLLKYAEFAKPDVIASFAEVPAIVDSGQKSNKRAITKNLYFLEKTIEKLRPMGTLVLAPIVASKLTQLMEESIIEMQKLEPDGYVIQGLHQGESFEERDLIYSTINKAFVGQVIKEKKIVLSSPGEPCDIMHAIYHGILLFETEYPFRCAEKGLALGFDLAEYDLLGIDNQILQEDIHGEPLDKIIFQQGLVSRCFNLTDQKHKLVLEPLLEKCECYTCKNHTQAYIHHLLDCDEMTANVLLTIHNVFNYQKLMDHLDQCESKGRIDHFIRWFMDTQCTEKEKVSKVSENVNKNNV